MLLLAKRIDLDIQGLTYGAAGPILRQARASIEDDLMATAGWQVGILLGWEVGFWLITGIAPANGPTKARAKITLRGIGQAGLSWKKQKGKLPSRITGLVLPLVIRTKTVHPYDLIDATVRPVESLQLY